MLKYISYIPSVIATSVLSLKYGVPLCDLQAQQAYYAAIVPVMAEQFEGWLRKVA